MSSDEPLATAPENSVNSGVQKKRRQKRNIVLAIFIVALIPTIGRTFAGSITVNANSGGKVEFGQGISATTSCDTDVLITPDAEFSAGNFYLSKITISNISVLESGTVGYGAGHDCVGKTFKIYVIDSLDAKQGWTESPTVNSYVSFKLPLSGTTLNSASLIPNNSNLTFTYTNANSESGTVVMETPNRVLDARNVVKIILQTQ